MKRKYADLLERVTWTFIQGFGATWLVTQDFDTTNLKIGAIAGLASAVKCIVGFRIGNRDSASTVPSV